MRSDKHEKPTWGGARPGAGRPANIPGSAKVKMNFLLDAKMAERIRKVASDRNTTPSVILHEALRAAIDVGLF